MWFEAPHPQAQLRRGRPRPRRATSCSRRATPTTSAASTASARTAPSSSRRRTSPRARPTTRVHGCRIRRVAPFFADVMGQPGFARRRRRGDPAAGEVAAAARHHCSTTATRSRAAARASSCSSVPGGETDRLARRVAARRRIALVGNMFSALFGHFPNLVTMRGDRIATRSRSSSRVQRVHRPRARDAARSATTVRCAARRSIRAECERIRDAVLYVHDATVDGDERGRRRVDARCARSALPRTLELGRGLRPGRLDVRAIWETYAGWFHQHSTLELYGVPPEQACARDRRRSRAGPTRSRRAARRSRDRRRRSRRCGCASSRSRSTPRTAARSRRTARAHAAARRHGERELLAHALARRRDPDARAARAARRRREPSAIRIDDLARPAARRDAQRAALDYVATLDVTLDARRDARGGAPRAGLDDFGAATSAPRLARLVDAVEADTGSDRSAGSRSGNASALLANRLLVEDLVRRRPEILDDRARARRSS